MLLNSAYEEKNFAIFSNKIVINKNELDSADINSFMKKFIIAIMFVMMISSTAFGHEYCGQKCKNDYKEKNDENTYFYVAEGCAAHRAFQEFKSFEISAGNVSLGYFVDKISQ